jgi:hypothetical protein
MMETYFAILGVALVSALICAKWAMELGFSQFRQILWGIVGLVLGPFGVLMLHVRLLRIAPDSARRWF